MWQQKPGKRLTVSSVVDGGLLRQTSWLITKAIFRSATKIKLQKKKKKKIKTKNAKQLYVTRSTDPQVIQCVSTCLPGLPTQAVRRPTMPFVEFILH